MGQRTLLPGLQYRHLGVQENSGQMPATIHDFSGIRTPDPPGNNFKFQLVRDDRLSLRFLSILHYIKALQNFNCSGF